MFFGSSEVRAIQLKEKKSIKYWSIRLTPN
jgi:hypothetical protein